MWRSNATGFRGLVSVRKFLISLFFASLTFAMTATVVLADGGAGCCPN